MPFKRIVPVVNKTDLGHLRLWRDDLEKIIGLIQQLPHAAVRIEADGFEVEDFDAGTHLVEDLNTGLPEIGPRLGYFDLTAQKLDNETNDLVEALHLRLTREACWIEATNPDPDTRGVIADIVKLTAQCSRLPQWLPRWHPMTTPIESNREGRISAGWLLVSLAALLIMVLSGLQLAADEVHGHHTFGVRFPEGPWLGPLALVVFIALLTVFNRSQTLLFTGTRAGAPTWWQRYRSDVGIAIVVAAVFYLLGLLTARG